MNERILRLQESLKQHRVTKRECDCGNQAAMLKPGTQEPICERCIAIESAREIREFRRESCGYKSPGVTVFDLPPVDVVPVFDESGQESETETEHWV